jgi:hypothetical protein
MEQLSNNDIKIINLPLENWREYKEIRLRALKADPQAFSSNFAKESAYPDEKWQQRLKTANEQDASWLYFAQEKGELVGMIGGIVMKRI